MSAGPVIRAASGGVARRRVQSAVIFMVLLASTAAATLGLALLASSDGPFVHSFAAQRGADVSVAVSPARVTAGQLAATARLPGVTAAAGPFPAASATFRLPLQPPSAPAGSGKAAVGGPSAFATVTETVIGRASPSGPVDDLTLISGHWVRRPGQVVLANSPQPGEQVSTPPLGSKVTVTTAPGKPRLTVVGIANSITDTASAWVVPSQAAALRASGAPPVSQMLYRFVSAGSAAQIRQDVAAVRTALPTGAILGTSNWLTTKAEATGSGSIIAPFVVAFAVIGLVMSVLIVANVVSGAVVASYRRIGVLKSIGFTPSQVVVSYLARVGVPAVIGCALGVVLGDLLALPVLQKSAAVYSVGGQSVPVWVDVAAPLLMCALVAVAALAPALRAGRLSAVQAISTGQAPRQGRGYAVHRLASRLRLPRPVSIGLAAPFARPARTAFTVAAILFGVVAVIFAVGLDSSLALAAKGVTLDSTEQVLVQANGPASTGRQDRLVVSALRAQPGTQRWVAEAQPMITVSGLSRQVPAEAFRGDATWTGYEMISGRWFTGHDEADVNTAYLTQTGLSVGDSTTVSAGGKPVTVRIAGEVFDPQGRDQPALLTSWQTLGGRAAGLTVAQYDVQLAPGVDPSLYASALSRRLPGRSQFNAFVPSSGQFFSIATGLISILTLMLAVVAGLGVLNTVLLSTRDRTHDLGVFKAVGMTPRQTVAMVLCWVVGPAICAGVVALPVAEVLHADTVHAMGNAAYTGIPASFIHVYPPPELALLALSGLAIAAVGAALPAGWAARARTALALRTE
jgi:putative ABC transport system permease protein